MALYIKTNEEVQVLLSEIKKMIDTKDIVGSMMRMVILHALMKNGRIKLGLLQQYLVCFSNLGYLAEKEFQ